MNYRPHAGGGKDQRGNSTDRRRRKVWLLKMFGQSCWHCGCRLWLETVQADRIIPGGSYRRDNIVASCADCNIARSNNLMPPEAIPTFLRNTNKSAIASKLPPASSSGGRPRA